MNIHELDEEMSNKSDEQLRSELHKHSQQALDLFDESDIVQRQIRERNSSSGHSQLTSLFIELQDKAIVELRKMRHLQNALLHRQKRMLAEQKIEFLTKSAK